MLTTKLHKDGELYHAQYVRNIGNISDSSAAGEEILEFILDEGGDMIPARICLCNARSPSECCCGCTSWCNEDYLYD